MTRSHLNSIDYCVVIPARYASRRLPGKALQDINGKTLLQHVFERAGQSAAREVIIATDDPRIERAARAFGADVQMTDPNHATGSDRIAEVVLKRRWDPGQIVVNLQGDEPLMPSLCLDQVATLLGRHPQADAATLFWPIEDQAELLSPNVVKVVLRADGTALMFSRAVLPFPRDYPSPAEALAGGVKWRRHLGLYAYRADSLLRFSGMPAGELEQVEQLEQLRYLESGGAIMLEQACMPIPAGVDSADDLERVRKLISGKK